MSTFRRCTKNGCGKRLAKGSARCDCGASPKFVTWCYRVRVGADPKTGAPLRVSASGFSSEREAGLAEATAKQEASTGVLQKRRDGRDLTFEEWARQTMSRLRLEATTQDHWELCLFTYACPPKTAKGNPRPGIGPIPLAQLDEVRLDVLYRFLEREGNRTGGPLSAKTVRLTHVAIFRMLAVAAEEGKVAFNVAAKAHPPKAKDAKSGKAVKQAYTPGQLGVLLDAAEGSAHRLASAVHLAACTGARRESVMAVRTTDLGTQTIPTPDGGTRLVRTVRFDQAVTVVRGVAVWKDDGKTANADHELVLDDASWRMIERRLEVRILDQLAAGEAWAEDEHGPLLFCDKLGRAINPERFSGAFRQIAGAAGLPTDGGPHARLRHGYLTAMIRAGLSPELVKFRGGHGSVATTLDLYVTVRQEDDADAADRTADYIRRASQ